MPVTPRESDLLRQIADLNRRIRVLETTSRMRANGQPGGSFVLNESDGTGEWMRWGEYTDQAGNLRFGFMVNGVDGDDVGARNIEINTAGLAIPGAHCTLVQQVAAGLTVNIGYSGVTSAAFVGTHICRFFIAHTNAVQIEVPWSTDAATTGELRLSNQAGGPSFTNVFAMGAASSGFAVFRWRHGQPVSTGPFVPQVEARRTGGAGNVNIFNPYTCFMTSDYIMSATSGGI